MHCCNQKRASLSELGAGENRLNTGGPRWSKGRRNCAWTVGLKGEWPVPKVATLTQRMFGEETPPSDCLTIDQRPIEVKNQHGTSSWADVADREGTNFGRFWLLLERAGYEV